MLHPRDVLHGPQASVLHLPVCDHYSGTPERMRKSLQLQADMTAEFGLCVFDVTLDCEDGAAAGAERAHHGELLRPRLARRADRGEEDDEAGREREAEQELDRAHDLVEAGLGEAELRLLAHDVAFEVEQAKLGREAVRGAAAASPAARRARRRPNARANARDFDGALQSEFQTLG